MQIKYEIAMADSNRIVESAATEDDAIKKVKNLLNRYKRAEFIIRKIYSNQGYEEEPEDLL